LTVLENARTCPFAVRKGDPWFSSPVDSAIHGSAALILPRSRARARGFLRETVHRSRDQKWTPLNESSLFRHSGHARKQNRTASPGLFGLIGPVAFARSRDSNLAVDRAILDKRIAGSSSRSLARSNRRDARRGSRGRGARPSEEYVSVSDCSELVQLARGERAGLLAFRSVRSFVRHSLVINHSSCLASSSPAPSRISTNSSGRQTEAAWPRESRQRRCASSFADPLLAWAKSIRHFTRASSILRLATRERERERERERSFVVASDDPPARVSRSMLEIVAGIPGDPLSSSRKTFRTA